MDITNKSEDFKKNIYRIYQDIVLDLIHQGVDRSDIVGFYNNWCNAFPGFKEFIHINIKEPGLIFVPYLPIIDNSDTVSKSG